MNGKKLSCAVYTRKSTEEGLDQDFNSLDAQYEACSAFIASQAGLGWKLIPDRYGDGGISGGTMERPALRRLLADIRDRKVDVVVVYKIDRLTRSLMDFSRIVDILDGAGASFVSVTQQFNTTTSMGRLTLNVLLSFAQFEREVTAERIRDKIAASKKKGMWMGGTVPLGYQVRDRKLLIKEPEATFVRGLFSRYLELRSVPAVSAEMTRQATASEHQTNELAPQAYVRRVGSGMLYKVLSNPLYIGKLKHRQNVYQGEHQPIVDAAIFDKAQSLLTHQAATPRGARTHEDVHLLTGLLFDDTGDRMSPAHAIAHGRRYRYYLSSRIKGAKRTDSTAWRIPAVAVDALIQRYIMGLLADRAQLSDWIGIYAPPADMNECLRVAASLRDTFPNDTYANQRMLLRTLLQRVTLGTAALTLVLRPSALVKVLTSGRVTSEVNSSDKAEPPDEPLGLISIDLHIEVMKRGNGMRLVVEGEDPVQTPDPRLIALVARAHLYIQLLTESANVSIGDVAKAYGVHRAEIGRILPLAFLAPKMLDQVLTGRQPKTLSALKLARNELPHLWADQPAALN